MLFFIKGVLAFLPNECQQPGVVALTFEDGPSDYTEEILAILKKNSIKASFNFSTASLNSESSKAIKQASEEGHVVGLRTNPQRNYFDVKDQAVVDEDLQRQVTYIEDITGKTLKFARTPVENNVPSENVYNFFLENNIILTTSSYSPYDVPGSPSVAVADYLSLKSPSFDSCIISLYGARLQEDEELQSIINAINNSGFSFVTLQGCLPNYKPGETMAEFKKNSKVGSGVMSNLTNAVIPLLMNQLL